MESGEEEYIKKRLISFAVEKALRKAPSTREAEEREPGNQIARIWK